MVNHEAQLTLIFSALGDPTRRRILEMLAEGERRVSELARPFRMSLPAISKHLQVLERAGLLIRRKSGRVHRMRTNPQAVRVARQWIEQYAQYWEQQFDALDQFLEHQEKKESES